MSRLSARLRVLSLVLVFSFSAFTSAQEMPPSEVEALKAGDKQAFELLDTIADAIPGLRAPENRIYLAGAVADLLWSKNEKRARALFDTVTREMVSAVAACDPNDQDHYNELGMIQQQRQETIDMMARHDPEMAMAFLRATRLPVESDSADQRANEIQLELHLAGLIAERDPDQALRIARSTLRKGVPSAAVNLLNQINARDRKSAQSLHREIVDQLKKQNLSQNHQISNTAWNLLTQYQQPEAKEDTYRELIELLAGAILSISPKDSASVSFAQSYYYQLQSAMPQIEKYAPGRSPALREWIQRVQGTQDPGTRMRSELDELMQKGTVDEILTLTGKYPPEFHNHVYQQAAWKALSSGDPSRARQIISELVTEPAFRRQLLGQLENQALWNTVQENKIAEARRLLSQVKGVEQRVNLLMSMAMNVAHKGDKKQALELLAETRALLDSAPQYPNKLNSRLQLVENYSSLDPEQSVALLESIIQQVNHLVAAAVVLDGFEHLYLREGEWMRAGHSNLSNTINNIGHKLAQLARYDPVAARYLSNQFERPEIRLIAQLKIAQSLLSGVHPTSRQSNRRFGRVHSR